MALVSFFLMKVYPRVCGVGYRAVKEANNPIGLSPRVRGRFNHPLTRPDGTGFIPACAGVGSLVFNVFEVMREPSMQIAYLFPELIVH